jgi:hypothetical protein
VTVHLQVTHLGSGKVCGNRSRMVKNSGSPAKIAGDPPSHGGDAANEFSGYKPTQQESMRLYRRSLPEDHGCRSAAVEALKIGFGGVA